MERRWRFGAATWLACMYPPVFTYLRSLIVYEVLIYSAAAAAFERCPYPRKCVAALRRSMLLELFDILRMLIRDINGKSRAAAFYTLNASALRVRRLPAFVFFISVAAAVKGRNISAALFAAGL